MDQTSFIFIGLDINEGEIEAHAHPTKNRIIAADDPEGWEQVIQFLPKTRNCLIAIESNVDYNNSIVPILIDAEHYVAVAETHLVYDYAHKLGILAGMGTTRAGILAQYIERFQPQSLADDHQKKTQILELLVRRKQLLDLCKVEMKRLEFARMKAIRDNLKNVIEVLENYIILIENEITEISRCRHHAHEEVDMLINVPGIGIAKVNKILTDLALKIGG